MVKEQKFIFTICYQEFNLSTNLARYVKQVHNNSERKNVRYHPDFGWDCPFHAAPHPFDNAKDLRLHLYYFHRHGNDKDLERLGLTIERIDKIPLHLHPSRFNIVDSENNMRSR